MIGPKRFVAPLDGDAAEATMREADDGNFVYWSEYEALAEAFTLYMEAGMDEPADVAKALAPLLSEEEIDFIVKQLEARKEVAPPPKAKRKGGDKK